ncbi:hypothetical protein GGF32_007282 [Allomyces javanicus]|nr:hypothetical protein GGF32_007282 [Allomyces javanicus]
MDVDSTMPEMPATPVPRSSSAAASVAATPVILSLRTSLESLRRENAIMALVWQYRIVEINHIFIRQIQDHLTAEVPPVATGAESAPVTGWQLDRDFVLGQGERRDPVAPRAARHHHSNGPEHADTAQVDARDCRRRDLQSMATERSDEPNQRQFDR